MTALQLERSVAGRLGSLAEARWLVEHALGGSSCGPGSDGVVARVDALVAERLAGVPLQYVLGEWSFRTIELVVDHRVLVPRPETEQVVEISLRELREFPVVSTTGAGHVAVDLGTGSGAIALSITVETAGELPRLAVIGTDADPRALQVAALNRSHLGSGTPEVAQRLELRRGDWWRALPPRLRGAVTLAVSNPPYVSAAEWPGLDREVHHEPYHALVASDGRDGSPGTGVIEHLVREAPEWLAPGGVLVMEIAPHQARRAIAVARRAGLAGVRVEEDLAGRERVLVARRPS